jgi:hypothetical protein
MSPGFESREHFHLLFLARFAQRFAGRKWAVKGGACLRFFHRSARFSEDMDIDVDPGIPVGTLAKGVEAILGSRAFLSALSARGVAELVTSAPKQTATVQRWKAGLGPGRGRAVLPTKLEFSRRRSGMPFMAGVPGGAILSAYSMAPFAAQYYGATELAAQKVAALASESRTAVRDLFDLDHLFANCGPDREKALRIVGAGICGAAARKARGFGRRDFREEVLPFLSGDLRDAYEAPASFEGLRARVLSALSAGLT